MTAECAIIGCGARTPLGFNRRSSAAAVRAGIAVIADHPFVLDRFGEPVKVARDAELRPDLIGADRLHALAVSAAFEALEPLRTAGGKVRTVVAFSIGEVRPGQNSATGATLARRLRDTLGGIVAIEHVLPWMGGHAGGIIAMSAAQKLIAEGRADVVLAGGIDSYLCRDTLEWLDDSEQIHSEGNIYGFCPGEAAGFVLFANSGVARRIGSPILARLVSVGTGIERNLIKTEDICLGEGLSAAFRLAGQQLSAGETVDRILCDMNGERYRGNEYGFAALKTPGLFKNAANFDTPADCWGDVGAASGPLYVSLIIEAASRGYGAGPLSLIWASSEAGQRGAAILRSEGAR